MTEKKKNDEFKEVPEEPQKQKAAPSAQQSSQQSWQQTGASQPQVKRLYRSKKDKVLGGVCGGIGEYFGIDPVLFRVLWVLSIFFAGFGILAYIICWIIIPEKPE